MIRGSEMERELKVDRTGAGLEVARQLVRTGVSTRDVAKNLGVSVPTLYRWIPASARS
ncbi:MAG: helix-turn-helix domain-containing protein [Gloeobacterales cyanobacterium]